MTSSIIPAQLNWSDNTPVAQGFDDIYFSKAGGVEESTYVFLKHNQIHERWQQLSPGDSFTIIETGFGTGLNFLITAALWSEMVELGQIPSTCSLSFISTELHPIQKSDLSQIHPHWPEFKTWSDALLAQYPMFSPGQHCLSFNQNIKLILCLGDARKSIADLEAKADCWYLDGFAPSKNPDMWSQSLFSTMAEASKPGASFATFTSARIVRDGLRKAGFTIEKAEGFGQKRDMIKGHFETPGPIRPKNHTPWLNNQPGTDRSGRKIAVIGAGIAGCATANRLVNSGHQVDVIEQMDYSQGMPPIKIQGVLYVKLSAEHSAHSEFYAQGFQHSLNKLRQLPDLEWQETGVIQTAFNDAELKRQQKFLQNSPYPEDLIRKVTSNEATQISGVEIKHSGLYFPHGAWINPISLCQQLLQGINLIHNTRVERLEQTNGTWTLHTSQGELNDYDTVIVACSNTATRFSQLTGQIPVKPIRGQKSFIQTGADNFPLKTVLCSKAYVTPALDGQINFGATFNLNDDDPNPREADHETNRNNIIEHFPALEPWIKQETSMGIVGFRCTSPDYMPVVGPVPVWDEYTEQYRDIARFKNKAFPPAPLYHGLYCNIGHGSRGLASVFLSAELLASQIDGTALPISRRVADQLNPARFLVKKIKQGKFNQ